jgi:hypothetical protein
MTPRIDKLRVGIDGMTPSTDEMRARIDELAPRIDRMEGRIAGAGAGTDACRVTSG